MNKEPLDKLKLKPSCREATEGGSKAKQPGRNTDKLQPGIRLGTVHPDRIKPDLGVKGNKKSLYRYISNKRENGRLDYPGHKEG